MSKTIGWLAILAALVGIVNEMSWISSVTWLGWVAIILAAIAGGMALMK